MKARIILSILLATALCLYGCEEKTEEEITEEEIPEEPDTVTLTIIPTPSDANEVDSLYRAYMDGVATRLITGVPVWHTRFVVGYSQFF